jgi:glycolate oxidase FAD binding subunit
MTLHPATVEELQAIILEKKSLVLRGGGTKPALSTAPNGVLSVDMCRFNGIIEYEPGEYTFTAYAGTPLKTIVAALAEHGQYLPFDPLLIEQGATLGGTVAANTSGSGRWRFGGVRDFILGVRFVDGQGRYVRSGGKVVKNAAGFDLPKFFVGSLGHYGALVEMSFKVFPQPAHFITLQVRYANMTNAMQGIFALMPSPLETDAIDIEPHDEYVTVLIRIGGLEAALAGRVERLRSFLSQQSPLQSANTIQDDASLWQSVNNIEWSKKYPILIKASLASRQIIEFDKRVQAVGTVVRYTAAGNVAWVALRDDIEFTSILNGLQLVGLRIRGDLGSPFIGRLQGREMLHRMKQVLDPHNIFWGD